VFLRSAIRPREPEQISSVKVILWKWMFMIWKEKL
jgi:hypothetical protein